MTVSAGIAAFPEHALDAADLMRRADGALYWAKRNGRDRCAVFSAEHGAPLSALEDADSLRREALLYTVHGLAAAVDAKDGSTHHHSQRVAAFSVLIARHLGLDEERVAGVHTAAILHDVGKIGVPDAVLLKPGRLTPDEYLTVQRHAELGHDIVAGAGMPEIAEWVLHHHERWDGAGYPAGLSESDIPLESRILHLADSLEAMTAPRVYRQAMTVEDAFELEAHSGAQFDPEIVRSALALVAEGTLVPVALEPYAFAPLALAPSQPGERRANAPVPRTAAPGLLR